MACRSCTWARRRSPHHGVRQRRRSERLDRRCEGETHIYLIRFEPGGVIGPHEAGLGQLFLPVEGKGWAAGEGGAPVVLNPGDVAHIDRGEIHSKGSDSEMTALIIQVRDLTPRPELTI